MNTSFILLLVGLLPWISLLANGTVTLETRFLKTWVTTNENVSFSVEIWNTGTNNINLVKTDALMVDCQIMVLPAREELRRMYERSAEMQYKELTFEPDEWVMLAPNERRVVRCRPSGYHVPFASEMDVVIGFYQGKDAGWFYSKPIRLYGVTAKNTQLLTTFARRKINDRDQPNVLGLWDVVHGDEHWLYSRLEDISGIGAGKRFYPLCKIAHPDKIKVVPLEQQGQFQVFDGDDSLLYNSYQARIEDGDARYTPLLNWTRERKAAADKHNAVLKKVVHEVNEMKEKTQ
jgi:hypothetical protein